MAPHGATVHSSPGGAIVAHLPAAKCGAAIEADGRDGPPAVLPRRVDGPAHRHGLRTHSTPIRYPHSLQAAAPGRLLSVGLRR